MRKPTKKTLDSLDMTKVLEYIPKQDTNLQYIDAPAGQEHYRLLTWLGTQVKGNILELGTFRGHSAVCLANGGNNVLTFDVEDQISLNYKPENVTFALNDIGHTWVNDSIDLIFIDTLHDGIYEFEVLEYLRTIEWKGVVVMDDIILFPQLVKLWDTVKEKKADWTDIGHHSGTGIIWFK